MIVGRQLIVSLVLCLAGVARSNAQPMPKQMIGEYYLTGVREVGSGLKLNADATFEFFFSYGAMDRLGHGTWKQQGNQLVLASRPRPPKDFALIVSKKVPSDTVTIRIVDENRQLLRYVEWTVKQETGIRRGMTDANGLVRLEKQPIEAISLRFELCPDRYSVFTVDDKTHNYFEFRFEPWIVEAFFENLTYTVSGNTLEGPHPLLEPGKLYQFKRQ